ncbi:MAG: universal stress protein [Chlorobiaceae bacterium]|nr:universal stress protein [Chlorobiaceae bacterium]NTV61730.1 universal stress protein [Chlorobiaceae bacterium]
MPEGFKNILFRHIAVAIDCSPHSMASLAAAAELAKLMQAELTGIFVEDINLLRMAELPFTHEIRIYTSEPEKIDPSCLERSLRLQAREAEAALEHYAGQFMLRHSFKVRRGMVPAEVMSASTEADLLVLGRSGRSPGCRKGLGSTVKSALAGNAKNILIMRTGFPPSGESMLVLYDGSEASGAALRIARSLLQAGGELHIIILPKTGPDVQIIEKKLSEIVPADMPGAELHVLPPGLDDSAVLARYIHMAGSGLVVLSDRMSLPAETVHSLIGAIAYPVLLVRGPAGVP